MTIWYPATAAKEDNGDDVNNVTQYANNVPTTPYKTRITHYTGYCQYHPPSEKYRKSYEETKSAELIRADSEDDDNDRSQCY